MKSGSDMTVDIRSTLKQKKLRTSIKPATNGQASISCPYQPEMPFSISGLPRLYKSSNSAPYSKRSLAH